MVGVWDSAMALRKSIFWLLWGLTFCGGEKNVSNVFMLNMMKSKKLMKGIWLEVKQGWICHAERQRNYAFELWCWRRLLRVPWTVRRSIQSILKEISPGCSLEGLMLKLKLQYLAKSCKELTHWKSLWCWEGLGAGGEGDDRGWDGRMTSPTWWT